MALEALESLAKGLKTPGRLEAIGGMACEMIRGRLHGGQGFSPLSPATAAYRGAGRPLQDTGALRDSITHSVVGGDTVSVGTNKPHAPIQNNGGVIRARKEWLWIPAATTRKLQRRFGYSPTDVMRGLRAAGYSPFRKGRIVCYRDKRKKTRVIYYLKKSVEIPARRFFYLSERDMDILMKEAGSALEQL